LANAVEQKWLPRLCLLATLLAMVVIVLGVYTRLTDAGLGCPDWPGCYGHIGVPSSQDAIANANAAYPNSPVEHAKAWTEMVHRYVAGGLGLLVFTIAAGLWRQRRKYHVSPLVPGTLCALIIGQALLGMWSVTMKLNPLIVMGHLLGGLAILCLLWFLTLRLRGFMDYCRHLDLARLRPWAAIGLAVLIFQLALGGWVSANYAALVCPDFPYCQGVALPPMDIAQALNVFAVASAHGQGNITNLVLVTIHMLHRIWAIITGLFLFTISIKIIRARVSKWGRLLALLVIDLVILQIVLGILNVVLLLPLWTAVLHNFVAALLLLAVVTLNVMVYASARQGQKSQVDEGLLVDEQA